VGGFGVRVDDKMKGWKGRDVMHFFIVKVFHSQHQFLLGTLHVMEETFYHTVSK